MRTALVLLLAFASWAHSADILRVSRNEEGLRVDPPNDLDWKTLLIQKLGAGVEKPSAARLRQLWDKRVMETCGCTAEYVSLQVPSSIAKRFYYLLSSSGVAPIVPRSLRGAVVYTWDRGRSLQLKEIRFTGDILMDAVTSTAGFVWVSDSPLQFKVTPVDETSLSVGSIRYQAPILTWTDRGFTRTALIESSYGLLAGKALHASRIRVDPGQAEYLFVRQETAEATCDFAFSLMKLTDSGMELAASNGYGCDV